MNLDADPRLRDEALRHLRRGEEVDDLVHDVFWATLDSGRAGRDANGAARLTGACAIRRRCARGAIRQRLSTLRKTLGAVPPAQSAGVRTQPDMCDPTRAVDLQFGSVRRVLKAVLRGRDGLGTHDPDGHLIAPRGRAHLSARGGNGGDISGAGPGLARGDAARSVLRYSDSARAAS